MTIDAPAPNWTAAEPYLNQALELDPQQRQAWLANLESVQPDIAPAVRGLLMELDALDSAGFLRDPLFSNAQHLAQVVREALVDHVPCESNDASDPTPALAALGLKPGAIVGPYRLLREIGHGGMSSVWLAERSDGQLKREVALKLPIADRRMRVERFLLERDILAALTHPQVARLYDAGISESGQPYLAMEYVEGTALLHHCDERQLTIHERLQLFLQVLDAVQFAHAELVIHRDLKPSNILVTREGRPILLDFGISKLLIDGTAPASQLTLLGNRALTPDYASPEQIAGQSLGTASDIYSLGVILYELLTGSRPFRPKRDTLAALEEAILTEDPQRPSHNKITSERAAVRRTNARRLARTLSGDLDTIVLKALNKKPHDRYPSVTAFAQDIHSYLNHLPVSARPHSHWYRVRRFWTRHRIPVMVGCFSVLALLIGTAVAIWSARAAALERDRAVAFAERNVAVTDFLGTIISEAAHSLTPITVSEMLARSEKLALQDAGDVPENRAAILTLIAQQYFAMGDSKHSASLTEQALKLVAQSTDQALRSRLVCNLASSQAELGNTNEAINAVTDELRKLDAYPEIASQCLFTLTEISWQTRPPEESLRYAKGALEHYEKASRANRANYPVLLEAVAYSYHLNGHNSEANTYFERALRQYKASGRERRPPAVIMMGSWALVIAKAGMPKQALTLYDEMQRIEANHAPGTSISESRTVIGNRGRALAAVGRFSEAHAAFIRACEQSEQQDVAIGRLQCAIDLGNLAVQTGTFSEAAEHLKRAHQLPDLGLSPVTPLMLRRGEIEGRIALAAGRFAEARTAFDRVLEAKAMSPWTLSAQLGKVEIALATGHNAAAVQHAQTALQMARTMQGGLPYSNQSGSASLALGRAWQQQGNRTQAREALQAAVLQLSRTVDEDHPELVHARRLLSAL